MHNDVRNKKRYAQVSWQGCLLGGWQVRRHLRSVFSSSSNNLLLFLSTNYSGVPGCQFGLEAVWHLLQAAKAWLLLQLFYCRLPPTFLVQLTRFHLLQMPNKSIWLELFWFLGFHLNHCPFLLISTTSCALHMLAGLDLNESWDDTSPLCLSAGRTHR